MLKVAIFEQLKMTMFIFGEQIYCLLQPVLVTKRVCLLHDVKRCYRCRYEGWPTTKARPLLAVPGLSDRSPGPGRKMGTVLPDPDLDRDQNPPYLVPEHCTLREICQGQGESTRRSSCTLDRLSHRVLFCLYEVRGIPPLRLHVNGVNFNFKSL
jgi:hypothetical protein